MAETSTVARPYAKAAFEYARDQQALEAWSGQLATVAQVVSNTEFKAKVVGNPKLSQEQKIELLLDVCGELDESLCNFLRTVGSHGRLAALSAIAEQFDALRAQEEKRVDVTIVSAFDLDAAQQDKLATALKKRLNREISITTQVDRALMGGAILRAGDTVIDGSVRGRLNRLRDALSA
ncbi:F0F1 ATP synthase subunit delta [Chromohalobacter sp. TMW 2.2308]|uniref:ATP synthase subunit delta n=1 Tax=Chromohalobacter moromii TaxID=2860329 RepID=A0A9X2X368_9GAMM|nr:MULTISPECIES: F0F1 ATP synthase subunit delta [Chromohalobacter]MCK2043388.1 F0F1 ATP synthase subunit delta [Chromohalobacter moromii]MCT8505626.1 F0F1 ATP synthase subunit delta [Chromohalobacter moromii]MCT8515376.1 F0F1 ATP synthase subunit delta [Chromohalobacter sp. TMW 2.2271]CDQ34408.1 F-type ATPase subunit delta [Virgibacillus halodenitrificans]